jgi:hypothetical protein
MESADQFAVPPAPRAEGHSVNFILDRADRPAYHPVMSEFGGAAGLTGTSEGPAR